MLQDEKTTFLLINVAVSFDEDSLANTVKDISTSKEVGIKAVKVVRRKVVFSSHVSVDYEKGLADFIA